MVRSAVHNAFLNTLTMWTPLTCVPVAFQQWEWRSYTFPLEMTVWALCLSIIFGDRHGLFIFELARGKERDGRQYRRRQTGPPIRNGSPLKGSSREGTIISRFTMAVRLAYSGNGVGRINKVNRRWVRLVSGWVTCRGRIPSRYWPIQTGHPFVCRRSEYWWWSRPTFGDETASSA